MNLFRSEEHVRNWDRYDETTAASIRPVAEWAEVFSNLYFRERGRTDFISWARSEVGRGAFDELRHQARF